MNRFRKLFSRQRQYDDLAISIQEHLAEKTEELMEQGMSREEAAQAARRSFGNVELIEQQSREQWQWPALEAMRADVKYAFRQLIKHPGFSFRGHLQ